MGDEERAMTDGERRAALNAIHDEITWRRNEIDAILAEVDGTSELGRELFQASQRLAEVLYQVNKARER